MYTVCLYPGVQGSQKRASDLYGTGVMNGCKLPCGCWKPVWTAIKSPSYYRTHYDDQAGLKVTEICLSPRCWN